MLFRTLIVSAVMVLAMSEASLAQDRGATPPAEKCRATPQAENQGQQNEKEDTAREDQQPLAEKLEPCGGVLKPPPIGDQEMSRPAPKTDKMPEIKPGDLPGQQPSPEAK